MADTVEYKVCNVCNINKPMSDFYFRKEYSRYRDNCKKCKPLNSRESLIAKAYAPIKCCKDCGIEKPISEFQRTGVGGKWAQPYCKPCDAERKRQWAEKNAVELSKNRAAHYLANRTLVSEEQKIASRIRCNEIIKKAAKEYQDKIRMSPDEKKIRIAYNAKVFREKHREKIATKRKEYNKVRGLQKKKEWQAKMMNDVHFRLTKNLRGRVYMALKKGIKSDTTMNLLGCTIDYFKQYMENQFTEGMSWGNMGREGWHIDHKKPCDSFDLSNPGEQKICFHYSNMQPLWRIDNLKKGTKLDYKIAY